MQRVAGWVVSLAFIGLVALSLRGRFDEARDAAVVPAVWGLAGALVANVVGNGLLVEAWRRIVALVGPRLPWRTAAAVWAPSQLARFTVSVGHVGARAVLGSRHGVSVASGAVTTLVEIAWTAAISPLVILATWTAWSRTGDSLQWVTAASVVPAAILVLGVVAPRRLLDVVGWSLRLPGIRRVGTRYATRADRIDIVPATSAGITGVFVVNMGLRITAFSFVLAGAAGADQVGAAAVGAFALGHFVGRLAIFAPGGIGPREGTTARVLAPMIGAGPALGVVAFTRLMELAGELVFLGIVLLLRRAGDDLSEAAPTGTSGQPRRV